MMTMVHLMNILSTLALLILSSTTSASPLALPRPTNPDGKTFSVTHRIHNRAEHAFDGAWALRRAYARHGIPLPEALQKRSEPVLARAVTDEGKKIASAVAESDNNDVEYLSPVEVGGVKMMLDFDTGSSDLWVFSDRLSPSLRKGHAFYVTASDDASNNNNKTADDDDALLQQETGLLASATGTLLPNQNWSIHYGDGTSAGGIVYTDTVTIGNANATVPGAGVTAAAQAVEAATRMSAQFARQHSDGLLGLGFGSTNTVRPDKQRTWFENVKPQLREPLFTVALRKGVQGVYDFGFVDAAKYTAPLQYVNVNTSRGYWEYPATGYQVAGAAGGDQQLRFQAIADTGTTLLLLPPPIVKAYYERVTGAQTVLKEGGYVYPCSSAASLPDLTLLVGDQQPIRITVQGKYIDRGLSATGSGLCYGGIQNGSASLSIWGDVFLKSQFVVFEASDKPRVGFARQAGV